MSIRANPLDIGDGETSGILDVTDYFHAYKGETLLLGIVQAHAVRDGSIGGSTSLVEGGQIFFFELGGKEEAKRESKSWWDRSDD